MRAWLLLLVLVLAGCMSASTSSEDGDELPPLPPPRSNNPANNMGYTAVADITGRVPDSPWSRECVRQWTSAAYEYHDPPIVFGKPCLFYSTINGTIFWQNVPYDGDTRGGLDAAPIARDDAFFDWFVVKQDNYLEPGGDVWFLENGSSEPLYVWEGLPVDTRDGPRAVRLMDGSVHLMVEAASSELGLTRSNLWAHLWADSDGQEHHELLERGSGFAEPTLRGDEGAVVSIRQAVEGAGGGIYLTSGGAMVFIPVLGQLFDATVDTMGIHACLAIGPVYTYGFYPFGETIPAWQYEPIHTSALAQLAFTCDLTIADGTVMVVTDTPALVGDNPNPTGGSQAWVRSGLNWSPASLPFKFHSGDDLGTYNQRPLHVGANASGTTNGDPKCGHGLHMPPPGVPAEDWSIVWCNHAGDWMYVLDTPGSPLLGADGMLNPPFDFWGDNFDESGIQSTSVVLALPPGLEPTN